MTTATKPNEHPILFKGPMVNAILRGHKTQTRRIVDPQPTDADDRLHGGQLAERAPYEIEDYETGHPRGYGFSNDTGDGGTDWKCPYGRPGDHLWVRETWAVSNIYDNVRPRDICKELREGMPAPKAPCKVAYAATGGCWGLRNRPSIHMPRWASRITLDITDVRVERLQDITSEDAIAEGTERKRGIWRDYQEKRESYRSSLTPIDSFRTLWDSINAKRKDKQGNRLPYAWDDNPWVWVIQWAPYTKEAAR